jgi:hypothetical protein
MTLKDRVAEAVSSKDHFCGSVFGVLQWYTPCPRGEALHQQPKPKTDPNTGSSHQESVPPTGSHHRHRWKRVRDHLQIRKATKQRLSDYAQQD